MIQQHPDFQKEVTRLQTTTDYMGDILLSSQRNLQSAQDNIRSAMANLEYIDSSDSYLNILTNTRFFEMARNQKEGLEAVRPKALFCTYSFPT